MSRFPSLPLFTDAYIADTAHLTNEEHGAYLRLLMFAWRSPECRLPADDKRLALILGLTLSRWARLKPTVMAFWTETDGFWTQKRLAKEHAFVAEKVSTNRTNGKRGGRPKSLKNNDQTKANGSVGETERFTQTEPRAKAPTPTPIKERSEAAPLHDAPGSDASPALSLKDQLWIEGKAALVSMGVAAPKAGSMIGKWLRDTEADAGRVLWAIEESRRQASGDPVPYVTRLLSNTPTTQRGRASPPQSKDGVTSLLRELEGLGHGQHRQGSAGRGDGPTGGAGSPHHALPVGPRAVRDEILDLEPIRPNGGGADGTDPTRR